MPSRDDPAVKLLVNRILKENFQKPGKVMIEDEGVLKLKDKSGIKEDDIKKPIEERDIVWLSEISKDSIPIAGGKGANLAEMYNSKFPVPPAFVITAYAYKNFIETTGLKSRIAAELAKIDMENTTQLEMKAKEIQMMVTKEDMPKELALEIIESYETLNIDPAMLDRASKDALAIMKTAKEPIFVAVRSSATTEDLETASFAGQQETFLNIKGSAQLLDAVKKCWASLFTARAIYYRVKKGFPHEKSFLAVVVQKMVNSDKSGVIFSINPISQNPDEIIIESVFGLGEGIVSGSIAPDRHVVNKKTMKITETSIGYKTIQFTKSSAGNTIKTELPPDKVREQALEQYEIIRLASFAKELEDHYKKPQDTEWAIEYGKIYIVQTRPVTTLNKPVKSVSVEGTPILDGLSASPGIASGPVKIINSLEELSKIMKGDILVTKMTNPDMVVTMQRAAAIVTDEGGQTCHAAIVSREIGLPAIVGTRKATKILKEGQIITVNAFDGKIYDGKVDVKKEKSPEEMVREGINEELIKNIPVEMLEEEQKTEEVLEEADKEEEKQIIKERTPIKVYMNLGEPQKIYDYKDLPFDGIGLMRLEFVIASQIKKHPLFLIELGLDDKYIEGIDKAVSTVAKVIYPKPIIVRFSDFKTNEYRDLEGGTKYEEEEHNPMIGFRGVSRYISEEFEQAFRLECRAIKKSREQNDNVYAMLPFVRTTDEVKKCLEIMKSEGLQRTKSFKIYLMAEVPSMALIPEEFAKLDIDGASIGSNDLTQLVLGVDRDSALLGRLGYFNEKNPAVLVAINNIIKGFHHHGKTVGICGQAPSVYSEVVEFLVKEGIDSISVNPDAVEKVRHHVNLLEEKDVPIKIEDVNFDEEMNID
jgi:pyruvate,water dikinase